MQMDIAGEGVFAEIAFRCREARGVRCELITSFYFLRRFVYLRIMIFVAANFVTFFQELAINNLHFSIAKGFSFFQRIIATLFP